MVHGSLVLSTSGDLIPLTPVSYPLCFSFPRITRYRAIRLLAREYGVVGSDGTHPLPTSVGGPSHARRTIYPKPQNCNVYFGRYLATIYPRNLRMMPPEGRRMDVRSRAYDKYLGGPAPVYVTDNRYGSCTGSIQSSWDSSPE